jgi:F0F1-type ATP synthase assembly protein I
LEDPIISRERRNISQRKIRRIKKETGEPTFELDTQPKKEKTKGLSPNNKMYYTKVLFGLISGFLTGVVFVFLNDVISTGWWFVLMLISLLICIGFVRIGLGISENDVDSKRLWLSGTFTFVVLFIVSTALGWMILYPIFVV